MKAIYIFTGPVKTGKTTRLFNWIKTKHDAAGILSVMVDDKKHLYSIEQLKSKCLETSSDNAILIGKYAFDPNVFSWAREQLLKGLKTNPEVLIVDEIGFLELKGEGMEPAFSSVLNSLKKMKETTILLVVRESLLEEVIGFYNLNKVIIIKDLNEFED